MNREEFISYIKDPARLDKSSLSEINELLEEFPYFQSGHLLFLKNLHKLDHIRFAGQLKKSALFVANREILYRLLFDNNDTQVEEKKLKKIQFYLKPNCQHLNRKKNHYKWLVRARMRKLQLRQILRIQLISRK